MSLLTRVRRRWAKWRARRRLAAAMKRWSAYDGPDDPPSLVEEVLLYDLTHPAASPVEWRAYAVAAVQRAYRDGFVRGQHWKARDWSLDVMTPELAAELEAHEYSLVEQHPRFDDLLVVDHYDPADPLRGLAPAERARLRELFLAAMWRPGDIAVRDDE